MERCGKKIIDNDDREKNNTEIVDHEKNNIEIQSTNDLKIQLKILDYYKNNGFRLCSNFISKFVNIGFTDRLAEVRIMVKYTSRNPRSACHIIDNFEKAPRPLKFLLLSYYDDDTLKMNLGITTINRIIDGIYIRYINDVELNVLVDCLPK